MPRRRAAQRGAAEDEGECDDEEDDGLKAWDDHDLMMSRGSCVRSCVAMLLAVLMGSSCFLYTTAPPDAPIELYEQALRTPTETSAAIVERASRLSGALLAEIHAQLGNASLGIDEIDVVISGGGFRGQYAGGVISILLSLQQAGHVRVARWSGSSIGALTAAHFAVGTSFEEFFRVPYAWQAVWSPLAFWRSARVVREMMQHSLPPGESLNRVLSGGWLCPFQQSRARHAATPMPMLRAHAMCPCRLPLPHTPAHEQVGSSTSRYRRSSTCHTPGPPSSCGSRRPSTTFMTVTTSLMRARAMPNSTCHAPCTEPRATRHAQCHVTHDAMYMPHAHESMMPHATYHIPHARAQVRCLG